MRTIFFDALQDNARLVSSSRNLPISKFLEIPAVNNLVGYNSKAKAKDSNIISRGYLDTDGLSSGPLINYVWAGNILKIQSEIWLGLRIARMLCSKYTRMPVLWLLDKNKNKGFVNSLKTPVNIKSGKYTLSVEHYLVASQMISNSKSEKSILDSDFDNLQSLTQSYDSLYNNSFNSFKNKSNENDCIPVVFLEDFLKSDNFDPRMSLFACQNLFTPHTRGDLTKLFLAYYIGGIVSDMDMVTLPFSGLLYRHFAEIPNYSKNPEFSQRLRLYYEGKGESSPANGYFATFPQESIDCFNIYNKCLDTLSKEYDRVSKFTNDYKLDKRNGKISGYSSIDVLKHLESTGKMPESTLGYDQIPKTKFIIEKNTGELEEVNPSTSFNNARKIYNNGRPISRHKFNNVKHDILYGITQNYLNGSQLWDPVNKFATQDHNRTYPYSCRVNGIVIDFGNCDGGFSSQGDNTVNITGGGQNLVQQMHKLNDFLSDLKKPKITISDFAKEVNKDFYPKF
ncbi:hypothetical protein AB9G26_09620 [Francisella philomiragia]|uniref:hypothetical protein n=1 Tax=Francisella philomiragia TaxID=28110 RepID=UPI0035120927